MARQVLFVQGGGEGTHDEWDNRLVDSLQRELGPDVEVRYPRMPDEADPDFARWKAALLGEIAALGDGAVVVGHSIGGTVLVHTLAQGAPAQRLGGVFLVAAPYVGEGGWSSDDITGSSDLGASLPQGVPVYLYHGDQDDTAPLAHLALYEAAIPQAVARRLAGRDHQLNDDLSEVAADIRQLGVSGA